MAIGQVDAFESELFFDAMKGTVTGKTVGFGSQMKDAGNALVKCLKDAGSILVAQLKVTIVKKLTDLSAVIESIFDENTPFDLSYATYNIVYGGLELRRLGAGPMTKQFQVHYIKRHSLDLSISVPGAFSVSSKLHVQARYDLSEVFNVIFEFDSQEKAEGAYGCCVRCLADVGTAFCVPHRPQTTAQGSARIVRCMALPPVQSNSREPKVLPSSLSCQGEVAFDVLDCPDAVNGDEARELVLPLGGCHAEPSSANDFQRLPE